MTTPPVHTNNSPTTSTEHLAAPIARGREEIVEVGTGKYIGNPKTANGHVNESIKGDITLNFQDTDLREFVKAIIGDTLKDNYVIDPKVSGKVTLETSKPIRKNELFPLFEKILAMNNTAVVLTDGVYQILPKTQAEKGILSPSTLEQPGHNGYKVRIIPLQYIAAEEMKKICGTPSNPSMIAVNYVSTKNAI